MLIQKPSYYDSFRCIAGDCPDSCCRDWAVQVDDSSAAFYRSLPGGLGDRLRQVLVEEEGETVMTIVDGRCPMWREDGLCRIQAELGEGALCRVCREFPRLRHEYGDFLELGLELSCPEAARLILSDRDGTLVCVETNGGETAEYDTQAMEVLKSTRAGALELLDGRYAANDALSALLLYGYQAQEQLDGGEAAVDRYSKDMARCMAKPGNPRLFGSFFKELEILTPQWARLLEQLGAPRLTPVHLALARYLVNRYWLQAVADYDLVCRVKFVVICCLLVSMLPGDPMETAQLFSKEIENDVDNVDAILDGAYTCPAFTDELLLGLCLWGSPEG